MYINKGVSMYLYDIQLTEGNKAPTGYITAEEDVQAQIEQVKLNVDYIASDSSLTPSDKQQVANEWARIQGEYWSIMANAEKYDVPTDSFTAYFQALEDYLTPLLADMSTTSEITGTEFRDVFSDYYRYEPQHVGLDRRSGGRSHQIDRVPQAGYGRRKYRGERRSDNDQCDVAEKC